MTVLICVLSKNTRPHKIGGQTVGHSRTDSQAHLPIFRCPGLLFFLQAHLPIFRCPGLLFFLITPDHTQKIYVWKAYPFVGYCGVFLNKLSRVQCVPQLTPTPLRVLRTRRGRRCILLVMPWACNKLYFRQKIYARCFCVIKGARVVEEYAPEYLPPCPSAPP